jgi:hypothetical protein
MLIKIILIKLYNLKFTEPNNYQIYNIKYCINKL